MIYCKSFQPEILRKFYTQASIARNTPLSLACAIYTDFNIEYQKKYMAHWVFEDCSFYITDGERILAIMLLTIGRDGEEKTIDWYGLPATLLRDENELSIEAQNCIKKNLGNILSINNDAKITYKDFCISSILNPASIVLMENGCTFSPNFTGFADLELSLDSIWMHLRKRFKTQINRATKSLQNTIFDASNITDNIMDQFRQFHYKVAGRITRCKESWDEQCSMVRLGHAFIVAQHYDSRLVGMSLYTQNLGACYYGVGAYDRDMFHDIAISHVSIWSAMSYAKKKGYKTFVIGTVFYPWQKIYFSEKVYNIGHFKKGMSTNIVPVVLLKK